MSRLCNLHWLDGELQVSFEGSLRLQLAVEGFKSLLLLASQIQNEHSKEDLLNFIIVLHKGMLGQ